MLSIVPVLHQPSESNISQRKALLLKIGLLIFHPIYSHSESYEVVYSFHGLLGESSCRLLVKGTGSYDGKHEALVNI